MLIFFSKHRRIRLANVGGNLRGGGFSHCTDKDNLRAFGLLNRQPAGHIVLAGALATQAAAIGGGMHIAMHAMGKITLFFVAGAIYVVAHKTEISSMDGIGRQMPWTMVAFYWFIVDYYPQQAVRGVNGSALSAAEGGNDFFIFIYMLSSILSIAYLMPIVARAFFSHRNPIRTTTITMTITVTTTMAVASKNRCCCVVHRSLPPWVA